MTALLYNMTTKPGGPYKISRGPVCCFLVTSLVTSLYSYGIFWFYFSRLSNRIMRKKYLVHGDWSQSISP